eukprot:SAG31_NODE_2662_length_5279_cov_2.987645_2_plen_376_part_00
MYGDARGALGSRRAMMGSSRNHRLAAVHSALSAHYDERSTTTDLQGQAYLPEADDVEEWDPAAQFATDTLPPTAAVTTTEAAEYEALITGDLGRQIQQGTFDAEQFDATTVRTLMQPWAGGPTETERYMASLPPTNVPGEAPRQLMDALTGEVTNLEWLRALQAEAEAKHSTRRAAMLRDLIEVIRPKPPLTLRDTAPQGIEAKAAFFEENGFVSKIVDACLTHHLTLTLLQNCDQVCVEQVLTGRQLAAVQAAWNRCEREPRATWQEARSHCFAITSPASSGAHSFGRAADGYDAVSRKWFGMAGGEFGPLLEMDPAFLDVVHNDSPGSDEVWRVAERVLSPRWNQGESVRCTHVGPRTYLPDADRQGYTYWHR